MSDAAVAAAPPARPRIGAIDLVRGTLMIFIMLGHSIVNLEPGHDRLKLVAHYLLSGTVGFVTVSGLMVGWFSVVKRDRYDKVVRRYLVQAGRLLLFAHPLISVALFLPVGVPFKIYLVRSLFVTDTLAVLFALVVPIVPHTAPRTRLVAGIALIVIDAFLDTWTAPGPATQLVQELLCSVDPSRPHILLGDYGLLPVAGMFLIGTWIGHRFATAQREGREAAFAARLPLAAAYTCMLGATLVLAWRCAHWLDQPWLAKLLFPDYETTLYPIYLGWTFLIFAHAIRWPAEHPVVRAIALLGRTSLFVYVAQYYAVETIPNLLGWNHDLPPLVLLAYCLLAVPVVTLAAAGWNRWVKHA